MLLFAAFPALAGPNTDNQGSGGAARDEIVIGCVAPLTGDWSGLGPSVLQAVQLEVDGINGSGGLLGRPIRLVIADDKSDPATGAEACRLLTELDGAVAIIGSVMSTVSTAIAKVCQEAGVPMISPCSTMLAVTQVGDFIFRACFVDAYQGAIAASYARQYLNLDRAAIIQATGSDYPAALAAGFSSTFRALGGAIVAEEGHPMGAVDFGSQLRRILQRMPQIIFIPDYHYDAALIMRQARALGYKGLFLGGDGWDSAELALLGGDAVEGACYVRHWSPGDGSCATQVFLEMYRERYGTDPDLIEALSADCVYLLCQAVEQAGTTEGAAVRDALAASDVVGIIGTICFDEERNPVKSAAIMVVEDGVGVFSDMVFPVDGWQSSP